MEKVIPGYITGYVIETHLYVGNRPDVSRIMLYNGRRICIFAKSGDSKGEFVPGDLVEFHCGRTKINFDHDQLDGEYYRLDYDWACRITNENTIKTFFMGAKILNRPSRVLTSAKRAIRAVMDRLSFRTT